MTTIEAEQPQPEDRREDAVEERTVDVLREAGAIGPNTEARRQYLVERAARNWTPLVVEGQPLSEMIVDERDLGNAHGGAASPK